MKQSIQSGNEKVPAFNPASPTKQVLTEKGASPQILIPNYNETATDALGRKLVTHQEARMLTCPSRENWGDNITLPKTVKNPDMVGQALELMSYYSKTVVRPAYYDGVLQLRVSDAPDDREMVELICNTIVYDPGIAYAQENNELTSLVWITRNIMDGKENIASTYEKLERSANRYLSTKIYKTK